MYRWIFDRGVPYADSEANFAGYIGSCIDVTETKEARDALKKAQEAEIERLRNLLPICAYCKKIRNDRNYWEQIESYMSTYSNVMFSHGICPECETKVMAELKNKIRQTKEQGK